MEIGKTLYFFRRNNQFTQKELTSEKFDVSAYSRIENDNQAIHLDVLEDVLDKLSVSNAEFVIRASFNNKQQRFLLLYNYCAVNLNDRIKKEKLVSYYQELAHKQKNLRELSNYISISNYFSQYWEEVEALTIVEMEEIYQYIVDRSYYQQYDYTIISNMIGFFDTKHQKRIIEKAVPLVDEEKRDDTTKKYAYMTVINFISSQLYRNNLVLAEKYLVITKNSDLRNLDYKYRLHIQYLDDLLNYLGTKNYRYLEKIHYFIHLLENLGDKLLAKSIEREVNYVLYKRNSSAENSSYPINLLQ